MATKSFEISLSNKLVDQPWDDFLENTPNGHHVQTSLWAQLKNTLGWKAVRIIARKKENIVGGAQILMRPLTLIGNIGYISRGPIFSTDDPDLVNLVFGEIKKAAKKYAIRFLVIQPEKYNDTMKENLELWAIESLYMSVAPRATILINLLQSPDEILSKMRKKTRYNIRYGLKKGIKVREGSEKDINTFYELYKLGSQRNDFEPFSKEYIDNFWRIFDSKKMIKLFICEFKNNPITSLLVISFRDTVYSKLVGWSGHFDKLRPNEALEWAVIEWARNQGYKYYDLEGIDLNGAKALTNEKPLPESLMYTPTFSKIGFGGEVHIFPKNYLYIDNSFYRSIFKLMDSNIFSRRIMERAMKNIRSNNTN
jgi:lipid II:glycine glycyltransferase (peptidoglycan interpeptide bridge formation enzyme)